jgi:hypothetical protein
MKEKMKRCEREAEGKEIDSDSGMAFGIQKHTF